MAGLSQQQLFNGINSLAEDDISYHCIVTDNPFMAQIGLSVFTTGQLYNWMAKRNSRGEFVNLKYFNSFPGASEPLPPGFNVEDKILTGKIGNYLFGDGFGCTLPYAGTNTITQTNDWLTFSRWERKDRTGEYIKTRWDQWKYYDKYTYGDINFGSFQDQEINLIAGDGPHDSKYNISFTSKTHIDSYISTIITLNDLSRFLPTLENFYVNPKPDNWPNSWSAAHEFIMDIKNSKERCIEFSNRVTFVARGCEKEQCVNYKLYLYDFTNPKDSNRTVALNGNNLFISLPRTDAFGRLSRNDGSGEFDLPPADRDAAEKSNVIARLSLPVNPTTGELDVGKTVLVRLASDLPPATAPLYNDSDPIDNEMSKLQAFVPSTGIAIPMAEQNGNPLQWASQYANQNCKKNKTRYTITVQNHSDMPIPSGAFGYATKLSGQSLWSFVAISTYEKSFDTTPRDWSFTYLMMNTDNFFARRPKPSDKPGSGKFLYVDYETEVNKHYYGIGGANTSILDNFPAVQVTSWDFMGPNVGGNRSANSLSTTVFGLKNDGNPWPDFEGGTKSTPFFGCVFPDGYDTQGKDYDTLTTAQMNVKEPFDLSLDAFFQTIPAQALIFQNNNDAINREEGFNDGMFIESSIKTTLNHLPADIATNAAYDKNFKNGSALKNHYAVYGAFQISNFDNSLVASKEPYQVKLNALIGNNYPDTLTWMYEGNNEQKSTFNFKPRNPYKIQFRPLKHEVYAAGDDPNGSPGIEFNRGKFARTTRNYQNGNALPIYNGITTRHPWLTKTNWPDGYDSGILNTNYNLRYNYSLFRFVRQFDSDLGYNFPYLWYNPPNTWLAHPSRGSGAIGVIGASCTISFRETITFKTDSVFGMRSWFGPSNSVGGNIAPSPWYPSFGGDGNNYNSLYNTQLYARIFHHWPKEYTVYDPSKFAVFHFNTDDDSLTYDDYVYSSNDQPVPPGILINSDIPNIKTKPNTYRKEKLLPCTYTMEHTIGIDRSPDSIIIENAGTDYMPNDVFVVSGGAGVSPKLKAIVNALGGITGFSYLRSLDKGYGYKPADFANSTGQNGGLQIVLDSSIQTAGTGFSGRVIRGIIVEAILTDPKPTEIGVFQLTPSVPINKLNRSVSVIEPVTDSLEKVVRVNAQDMSQDKKYDIFLHFHNDTSHTLTYSDGASGPALENYVELEILPD